MAKTAEYAIKETKIGNQSCYTVTKFFDGQDQPANQYDVFFRRNGSGYCNCYAGMRKGNDDKHVKLVRLWLREKSPLGKLYRI